MDFNLIKERIELEYKKNRFTQDDLVKGIGLTRSGYRQMFEKKTLKVETLFQISQWLDMPLCYFLDPDETYLFRAGITENKSKVDLRLTALETKMETIISEIEKLK